MAGDPAPLWQMIGLGLGLGLAWVSLHCAGMCGPLLLGFRFGAGAAPDAPRSPRRAAAQLACYQAGRAVVYAAGGAAAGGASAGLAGVMPQGALIGGMVLAAAFLIAAAARLGWLRWAWPAA